VTEICSVIQDFGNRFCDFQKIRTVVEYLSFPFKSDLSHKETAATICKNYPFSHATCGKLVKTIKYRFTWFILIYHKLNDWNNLFNFINFINKLLYRRPPYTLRCIIFWDMTPCSPLSFNRHFGGTYRLHLQGRRNRFSKPASKQVASRMLSQSEDGYIWGIKGK
jgi:hypothetical protein